MSTKKDFTWLYLVIGVAIILIVAVAAYLFSKDECYTTTDGVKHCLSGIQALKLEWPAFWVFAIGGIVVAIILGIWAYNNENKGDGKKTMLLVILAVVIMCAPWAKGCTDKANGGITAPGYKHVDSTGTSKILKENFDGLQFYSAKILI